MFSKVKWTYNQSDHQILRHRHPGILVDHIVMRIAVHNAVRRGAAVQPAAEIVCIRSAIANTGAIPQRNYEGRAFSLSYPLSFR